MDLPEEYRFDTVAAARALAQLAAARPDSPVALTIARFGDGGLEGESELRLRAVEAAALLEATGDDQRLSAAGPDLYLLRVTRLEEG